MLALMIYNNNYTKYKVEGFNIYWYMFILSFCSMQLVEFFLWRNLDDPQKNRLWSMAGQLLLTSQPIASLLLLQSTIKYWMILVYIIGSLFIFYNSKKVFKTTTLDGKLKWSWIPFSTTVHVFWLFFLLFSFVVNKYYKALCAVLFLLSITYYSNFTNGTGGSLWCWTINFIMIFYAIYLLVFMPLQERMC